jgi:hypothetical protein
MFLIIAFRKSFKNVALVFFLELYGQKHKFESWFEIFLMIFFAKVIRKSLFLGIYFKINLLNTI